MRVVRGLAGAAGAAGVAVLAACGGGERAAPAPPSAQEVATWSGLYASDTLKGAAERKVMRLAVGRDTVAAVSLEFVGLGTTYHPGRWTASGERITMQPTRGDGTPSEVPFVWRREGDRLVPEQWDKRIYGDAGVTLTKLAPPAAPTDSTPGAKR